MNKKNKKNINIDKKYLNVALKTFIFTLFIIFICVISLILCLWQKELNSYDKQNDKDYEYEMIGFLIEKYRIDEEKNPHDYIINQNLGVLYELSFDLKKAENEFKKSIYKAPYYAYSPRIRLAELYMLKKDFLGANQQMRLIKDTRNNGLINEKSNFFYELGTALYDEGHYFDSIIAFQKSLFYKKKISTFTRINKDAVVKAQIAYADFLVAQGENSDALMYLNKALKENNSAVIMYKLALLYADSDLNKSLEFFEKTFLYDPTVINYDIYEKVLSSLLKIAKDENSYIATQLYEKKLESIKKYRKVNIIKQGDISVDVVGSSIKNLFWGLGQESTIIYSVLNNSDEQINDLYLYFQIFHNSDLLFNKMLKITNEYSTLQPHKPTPFMTMKNKFFFKNNDLRNSQFEIRIFANKNRRLEPTYVGSIYVKTH